MSLPETPRILDVGCGVGVLGVAVGKRHPGASITLLDRNVLAVALSEANAAENRVPVQALASLGLSAIESESRFDLVLSNFPAKAGAPVIRDFVCRVGTRLGEGGTACIVFVTPLAETVADAIDDCGVATVYREETRNHFVVHLRGHGHPSTDEFAAYIRTSGDADYAGFRYAVRTVYGLPEFDTLSYRSELLLDAMGSVPRRGVVTFVNPGQGHVACAVPCGHTALASDDVLQLAISRRNLEANGRSAESIQEIAHLGELSVESGTVVISYDPVPSADWLLHAVRPLRGTLDGGGTAVFASSSTSCHRLEKALATSARPRASAKLHGQRVLVYGPEPTRTRVRR